MRAWRRTVVAVAALFVGWEAAAQELVVDLSDPVVAITAGFAGTDLLLFGATQGSGDVVLIVRGPLQDEVVRRKERVGGVWVNRRQVVFEQVPSYYFVAGNRPLDEFVPEEIARLHQIGIAHLVLSPHLEQPIVEEYEVFRDALVRNKQRQGLYAREPGNLIFRGKHLFRSDVHFPANVPTGTYGIDVYLIRDGRIAASQTTLLNVRKFGLEAEVFDFAHRHSAAYGLLAIIIAVVAGWLGNAVFRMS